MDDSLLNKVQKISIIFTKWFLVIALVLIVGGAGYYLYKNSGYLEYKTAVSFLKGLTGAEKADAGDKFFGPWDTPNSYSGILAGSWPYGVWIWGKSGLRYQSFDQGARFLAIYGCSRNNIVRAAIYRNNKEKQFDTKVFANLGEWKKQVHSGNYVALDINESKKLISITAYPEFSVFASPWIFCNVKVPEQNPDTK